MSKSDVKKLKAEVRSRVWSMLEDKGVARFPRPVYGRIPNFAGAEEAALKLISLREFKDASTVKVNPDSPQRMVRYHALSEGKLLLTASPRLREGFLLLNPSLIPRELQPEASTIAGSFKYGSRADLSQLPQIDLVVMGSVAVSVEGGRLGKGGGYGELEYAVLRELKLVNDGVPVVTTVHDLQVVDDVPFEEHDVPVDLIVTPTRTIYTSKKHPKPKGILWSRLTPEKLEEIPLLGRLKTKTS